MTTCAGNNGADDDAGKSVGEDWKNGRYESDDRHQYRNSNDDDADLYSWGIGGNKLWECDAVVPVVRYRRC